MAMMLIDSWYVHALEIWLTGLVTYVSLMAYAIAPRKVDSK
jgi:hypothetical protein